MRLLNGRNTTIMARVLAAVNEITVAGYYERALALKALTWPTVDAPIFQGPALVLFAEDEDGVFVPSSPTLAALRRPSVAAKLFPRAAVHEVAFVGCRRPGGSRIDCGSSPLLQPVHPSLVRPTAHGVTAQPWLGGRHS